MLNRGLGVLVVGNKSRFPVYTCANPYCLYISANLLEKLGKSSRNPLLHPSFFVAYTQLMKFNPSFRRQTSWDSTNRLG